MVKKLLCECDACKKEFLIKYEGHIQFGETYCKNCINKKIENIWTTNSGCRAFGIKSIWKKTTPEDVIDDINRGIDICRPK